MLGIVYFDFTGQLFSPRVIVMFDFCLSSFGFCLISHLGLRLSLVGHICFQHCIYFCCFFAWSHIESGLSLVVK